MLLKSAQLASLPGLRHGFSTREGGVSEGPYASLNLGRSVGDARERVEENRRRFAAAAGFGGPEALAEVSQVHGVRAVRATRVAVETGALLREEADAVYTDVPGLALGVRTADCAPVLVAALDPGRRPRAVAAIHAGWRSAVGGIVRRTIAALVALGLDPERMEAAIGPAIGPDAFEVGDEVVAAADRSLEGSGRARTRPGPRGRPLLDLPDLVTRQLVAAGLRRGAVEDLRACTVATPDRFFSHRRDRGQTGRHLSAVQIAP